MSLQDSEIIKKIEKSAISGKTPELRFFSRWLENKIEEKKYKKAIISDYIFSLQILNSSYGKSDVNNENIVKLKSDMERWLRDDYGYELQKKIDVNQQTDNTKWSKAKFDTKIKSLTENITKLRNNYINNNDLDEDYVKNCNDFIEEIKSFINNSEVCHESSCFISSNDVNKKKLCPKAILKDCIDNYEGVLLLCNSSKTKKSDSLEEISKCIEQINEFNKKYASKYEGKEYSLDENKVKLMEKLCKVYLKEFGEKFRETKFLNFDSIKKLGKDYLNKIVNIKDEIGKEKGDYSKYQQNCFDYEKDLKGKLKNLEANSDTINDYKANVEEIKKLLERKPAAEHLEKVISKATELVNYWNAFCDPLAVVSKQSREYEKDILKKLTDLKKESEEYKGSPEGFSKELDIFNQTLTVQVYASEKNIVSSFFDNMMKWLHLG